MRQLRAVIRLLEDRRVLFGGGRQALADCVEAPVDGVELRRRFERVEPRLTINPTLYNPDRKPSAVSQTVA
jgi:hypothetical protein